MKNNISDLTQKFVSVAEDIVCPKIVIFIDCSGSFFLFSKILDEKIREITRNVKSCDIYYFAEKVYSSLEDVGPNCTSYSALEKKIDELSSTCNIEHIFVFTDGYTTDLIPFKPKKPNKWTWILLNSPLHATSGNIDNKCQKIHVGN